MKKKNVNTEVQNNGGSVIQRTDLVQIMTRVGEPSLIGEKNVSFYNVLAPIYADQKCQYTDRLKPGYRVRRETVSDISRNRFQFITTNMSRNIVIKLFTTILDPNDFFKDEEEFRKFNVRFPYQWGIASIEELISERSPLLDLSTTTDYAVVIATEVYNSIISLIGNATMDDEIYHAITVFMGEVLDYITYQLCLYKIEAVTVYKNAITIDAAAEERLALEDEINKKVNLSDMVNFILSKNAEMSNLVDNTSVDVTATNARDFYSNANLQFTESEIKGSRSIRDQNRRSLERRNDFDYDEYDD